MFNVAKIMNILQYPIKMDTKELTVGVITINFIFIKYRQHMQTIA